MMRLAVMRPKEKMAESLMVARELGFEAVCASPLEIQANDSPEFHNFLADLEEGKVDVMILTSSTGVSSLMDLVKRRMSEARFLSLTSKVSLVAIGPLTAKAMGEVDMRVDRVPEVFSSEGLVGSMRSMVQGKSVYVLRSDHGEAILMSGLREAGADAREVIVYKLVPVDSEALAHLVRETVEGRIDAFAFTSSLSATTFIEAAEEVAPKDEVLAILNSRIVAAMGIPTRDKLEAMGVKVTVVPGRATFREMLLFIKAASS